MLLFIEPLECTVLMHEVIASKHLCNFLGLLEIFEASLACLVAVVTLQRFLKVGVRESENWQLFYF
jgi:hypothetical protein